MRVCLNNPEKHSILPISSTTRITLSFSGRIEELEEKKVLKLRGISKGYDIDFSDLKKIKKQAWEHFEQEFSDG